jgi:hypothetical protein
MWSRCRRTPGSFLGQMDKAGCGFHRRLVPGHLHRPEDDEPQPAFDRGHGDGNLRLSAPAVRPHRHPHCPKHGIEITSQTVEQMVDRIMEYPERTRLQIWLRHQGAQGRACQAARGHSQAGLVRVRVDGEMRDLSEKIKLEKNKKHTIEVVVDRIVVKEDVTARLADSIETALKAVRTAKCSSISSGRRSCCSARSWPARVRIQHGRAVAAHVFV